MNKDTKIIPATIEKDGEIYVHVSDILTEKEINGKLQQELERYKNIVDELEKFLQEDVVYTSNTKADFISGILEANRLALNKLKELKGSDS